LTNVQPAQAGGYSVVVTNVAGSVTSVVATLSVLAPPTVTNPVLVGHGFSVSVSTALGSMYTLEYKNSLTEAVWAAAQTLQGTGGSITLSDGAAMSASRFYRVRVQ
jgi:pantoate kinase